MDFGNATELSPHIDPNELVFLIAHPSHFGGDFLHTARGGLHVTLCRRYQSCCSRYRLAGGRYSLMLESALENSDPDRNLACHVIQIEFREPNSRFESRET
jgi:hypothetical protein